MAHRFLLAALAGSTLLLAGSSFAQEEAASAARPAQAGDVATPFLFQITGKGTSAYLYGTVHLADQRVVTLPASVVAAFDESDAFYAEIEATAASEAKVQKLATMPAGQTLDAIVGPETWARIEGQFIKAGHPAMMAKMMGQLEPWAFSSLLPMLESLEEMASRPALDKMLYQRAEKAGKSVAGLETVEEQVALFQSFTRDEQVQMLRDSLTLLEEYQAAGRKVMEEMITAWMSGDSQALLALLDDGFGKDPVLRERAEHALLWERNVRFAERMEAAMAASPAKISFFAVGALHIPDAPKTSAKSPADGVADAAGGAQAALPKLGVVELMRKRGYTVTRVSSVAPVPAKAPK